MSTPSPSDACQSAWLTTVSADGSEHTTPAGFAARGERLRITTTSAAARKVQKSGRDARLSLALDGSATRPQVALGRAVIRDCRRAARFSPG